MKGVNTPAGSPPPPAARTLRDGCDFVNSTLQNEKKRKKISLSLAYVKKKYYLCRKFTTMDEKTKKILKVAISVIIAALTALAAGLGLSSCNVTRTVTTQSQYYQKGDTTCTIVTKTIETYDATKKGL